jgi:hypothetical protein
MSDPTKIPDPVLVIAEQSGIARALKLFPDQVRAAGERGLRPLGDLPPGNSAITHPAPVFDPARFENDK